MLPFTTRLSSVFAPFIGGFSLLLALACGSAGEPPAEIEPLPPLDLAVAPVPTEEIPVAVVADTGEAPMAVPAVAEDEPRAVPTTSTDPEERSSTKRPPPQTPKPAAPKPAAPKPAAPKSGSATVPAPAPEKGAKNPPAPKPSGISQVNETSWTVTQSLVNLWQNDPYKLGNVRESGEGWQLVGIRQRNAYHLGMRNSDIVLEINGHKLNTQPQLLAAYLACKNDKKFDVVFLRDGKRLTHHYTISN